ncbi:7342_t:CDS:2, partial [Paraglomus occultum]
SRGYRRVEQLVKTFDPNLTLSRINQQSYYNTRHNRTQRSFAAFLQTLTYWRIPASFDALAVSVIRNHSDVTVGSFSDLTPELEDLYIREVDNYVLITLDRQRRVPDIGPVNFPPTPQAFALTPFRNLLVQGSQLINEAEDVLGELLDANDDNQSILSRNAFGPDDNNSPLRVLTQQERAAFATPEPSDSASEHNDNPDNATAVEDTESEASGLDQAYFEEDLIQDENSDESDAEPVEEIDVEDEESTDEEDDNQVLVQLPPIQAQPIEMVKHVDYPMFTGSNPAAWARAMDMAFAANQVNDEAVKINIAATHLGDYVEWFAGQAAFTHWTDGNGAQDRNMKDIFLAAFNGPEEKGLALSQMWKRKQRRGETLASYVNGIQQIWSATGEDIPVYIRLDPSIQPLVKAQNPQNIADAIAAAKRVYTGGAHGSYLTQEEEDPSVTGLLAQIAELTKQMNELKSERKEPQPIQRERAPRMLLGHIQADCYAKKKGKGASAKPIRPSNAAQQYGASDDSGPLCCKAIVQGEEIVALVDTGSALTLVSKALYDRIAHKLVNPKLEESNVKIMGIAGLRKNCEGRINNLSIKFKEKEWRLNAEVIPHPSVDVILGQNFLMEVKAEISLPKLQMTLGDGKEQISLYREPSKYISICLMTKAEKKPWWKKKKEVPKSEWKCEYGANEQTCTQLPMEPIL